MNILYYAWREFTYEDAVNTLRSMDHNVIVDNTPYTTFDEDEKLIETLTSRVKKKGRT